MAKWSGISVSKLPKRYQPIGPKATESILYVNESLSQAIHNHDLFAWVALLEQFESDFLQPLLTEIKLGTLECVELVSSSGNRLKITRKLLRRWWRRKSPFFTFLSVDL